MMQVPMTAETRHFLGPAEFARMRPGAIVVNTGRGPTIDNQALYDALVSGRVAGAGLDDPEEEPAKRARWEPAGQSAVLAAERDRHAARRLLFGGIDPPRARDGRERGGARADRRAPAQSRQCRAANTALTAGQPNEDVDAEGVQRFRAPARSAARSSTRWPPAIRPPASSPT